MSKRMKRTIRPSPSASVFADEFIHPAVLHLPGVVVCLDTSTSRATLSGIELMLSPN